MSGQQPWQTPDRQPRQPGQEEPKKKSRSDSFRDWITTTAGITSSVVTLVGLLAGGTAVSVKVFTQSSNPSASSTPTPPNPNPSSPPNPSPVPAPPPNLQSALLSSGAVGSAAYVGSSGTDLSQLGQICGGNDNGTDATAYESILDRQTGTDIDEALVSWNNAGDAGQAIAADRQAVDQSGRCSITSSGVTTEYTGDNAGSPPSTCEGPGQYFATQVNVTSPSFTFQYFGFLLEAQCGTTTISIRVYSDLPEGITQQAADGYLNLAIAKLDSTNS